MQRCYSVLLSVLLGVLLAACAGPAGDTTNSMYRVPFSFRQAAKAKIPADLPINVDSDTLASGSGDIWDRIRQGYQLPNLKGNLVDAQLRWYTTRPDYVQRMTERSALYLYYIVEALEARHMPTELALLPFIESGYNPQALSVAKAAGMWQFIPGTGRSFNLKQNIFQDERRDVLASTNAALDYLTKLYSMFGDWHTALAAYNWGEGNVQRAIARNRAAGRPIDYQSLKLPAETRNYVPKLQAVKNIIARPQTYSLTLPPIPNHPYFVTVTTERDIDVKLAAQFSGLSLKEFTALNPSFKKPVILGATRPQILLPFENAQAFEKNLNAYQGTLSSWTTYTVAKRARPAALAAKIGVNSKTLIAVNKIPVGMRLKPGATILVPKSADAEDEDISAEVAESAFLAIEPDLPATRKMLLRIRKHENMSVVAKRYRVSVAQIQTWNKTKRTRLVPGQIIVLHVANTAANRPVVRSGKAHSVAVASRVKTTRTPRAKKVAAKTHSRAQASRNARSNAVSTKQPTKKRASDTVKTKTQKTVKPVV